MKSILIYFRRDDSLGRGRASNPSGGWHIATGSHPPIRTSSLLLLHHEEPSRGSGPIYRYQENRGEERG